MLLALLLFCVGGLLATALIAAAMGARHSATAFTYTASLIVSALALAASVLALIGAGTATTWLPVGLPGYGAHFRIDALSSFFLVVVNLGGAAASLYGIGYGRHELSPRRVLPFFPAFLAGMNLVVVADDAFSFLFAWELMSLMSWALVMSHDREPENLRAGYIYIIMAGFGTMALLLAFGILAGPAGNYAFASMRAHGLEPGQVATVLALVLIGAGSKAGVVPLHVWLPLAHPAAPSHVSALMSGVMTKVAVYAFVRIAFDLLGSVHWGLAAAVIMTGGVTAVLGVLYALMQHDLKRLLAYHTVENIGIIFAGLGLAMAFRANGLAAAAALAATAALFHVLNHSLFKSLLFFGAGAVLSATGERDMEKLGGLAHTMPRTATLFLIGAAAISALPPLNGFASEWMTFQAIFLGVGFPQWGLKFLSPAIGAMLALAAALAAACFVKAYGITFLGRARSPQAESAQETDGPSLTAMSLLAGMCAIAGLLPGYFTNLLGPVSARLTQAAVPAQDYLAPWSAFHPAADNPNSYGPLAILATLALLGTITVVAVRRLANPATRRGPAWDCGFPLQTPAMQYSAGSFAQPIRRVFGVAVFRAREDVFVPPPGDLRPATFHVSLRDPVWHALFNPVVLAVGTIADRLNPLQYQSIRRYLSLVFAALVLLLVVLAIWA